MEFSDFTGKKSLYGLAAGLAGWGAVDFRTPPPSVLQSNVAAPLQALLDTVVVIFRDGLQVVFVPEQALIATVGTLVVDHRTIRCRVLPDQRHTGCLTTEPVAPQDLPAQLLPARRLVPRTPALALVPVAAACHLTGGRATQARRCQPKARLGDRKTSQV